MGAARRRPRLLAASLASMRSAITEKLKAVPCSASSDSVHDVMKGQSGQSPWYELQMTNESLVSQLRASAFTCQSISLCTAHAQNAALEGLDEDLPTSGSLAYVYCPKYASTGAVIFEVNPRHTASCFCRHTSHWGPFGRSLEKSVHERLGGVQQRYQLLRSPK